MHSAAHQGLNRMRRKWRIFLLRCFGAKVGTGCVLKSSCEIWQPWKLEIGDYVALSEHVICYTVDRIKIGSQTTVSREAFLYFTAVMGNAPLTGDGSFT